MDIDKAIQDRIFAAADALYAASDRKSFPTVDVVRREARVNMNDASQCMKLWRRAQTPAFNTPQIQLPPELNAACIPVLAQLWQQAVALANEPLRTAHATWEAERISAARAEQELVLAYDQQSLELSTANAEIARMQQRLHELNSVMATIRSALTSADLERTAACNAAREADVRAKEIGHRTEDLRKELDLAHTTMDEMRTTYAAEISRLHAEAKDEMRQERERADQSRLQYHKAMTAVQIENAELRTAVALSGKNRSKRGRTQVAGDSDGGQGQQDMTFPS